MLASAKFHQSQNDLVQRYSFDQKYDARVTIYIANVSLLWIPFI
jgi:hypothetical protein